MENEPLILEEHPGAMAGLTMWAPPDLQKPRHLTPVEKIAHEREQTVLGEKAEVRSSICWEHNCNHRPHVWVREVQFDLKGEKAEAGKHAVVSSSNYSGAVPGFCLAHIATGPAHLAQTIYFSKEIIFWGLRPKRWFVCFTDDTKTGGSCLQIDPIQLKPKIIEEFIASPKD